MGLTVQGNNIVKGDQLFDCAIKIVKGGESKKHKELLTLETLKENVDCVINRIENGRLWFPVCKYMMWEHLCADGDFADAVEKLQSIYPDRTDFNAKDLKSLDVLCFSKSLDQWKLEDSPIKDKTTFQKYLNIATILCEL